MTPALAVFFFPGVLLRESLRLLACRATGTAVFRARFFPGPILHERVERPRAALALAGVPLAAGWLLGAALLAPAVLAVSVGGAGWIEYGLAWLGASVGIQGAPGREDARTARALLPGGVLFLVAHYLGPVLGLAIPASLPLLL
jgi:hypothetical protein